MEGESIHRSELAREKPESALFIQDALVIVDVLREQARSYKAIFQLLRNTKTKPTMINAIPSTLNKARRLPKIR